ncbi:hypothetical protein IMSHALPRED_007425 [Imshaugia aleurites]|uniref:Uncharacterized protein n=1 Tax=Imshaugia aleurites TaxID=172621 RepID=A0A8H3IP87_9LECA|nr:hypothetical protein IMSHALPRED_007425 [Imshaugia aleurites]
MIIQLGLTVRGIIRRHRRDTKAARELNEEEEEEEDDDDDDDGKVAYLIYEFQAWTRFLQEIWQCVTEPGMAEESRRLAERAARLLPLAEEVRVFVQEMEERGVRFLSGRWEAEAWVWMERLVVEGRGEEWRERFLKLVRW